MNRVIIATAAYNAEKTLPRAIQSILEQTHHDWIWVLMDNGSTDRTGEIIQVLAKEDSRVVYRSNKINGVIDPGNSHSEIIEDYDGRDFYCQIDADDEYKPLFLEKSIEFALLHNLDVVASGSDFIKAETHQLISQRKLDGDLLLTNPEALSQHFPRYFQFMRTLWGKLYKLKYLQEFDYSFMLKNLSYGGDTYINLWVFSEAKRIGIIGDSLHKYYISNKSMSYQLDPKRMASDFLLYEGARDFLIKRCGNITLQNQCILNGVYYHAIKDTLNVIFRANLMPLKTMDAIQEIFTSEYTQQLFGQADIRLNLEDDCASIAKWVFAQNVCWKPEGADKAARILLEMYRDSHQFVNQEQLRYLLLNIPDLVEPLLKKEYFFVLERLQKWYKRHDADNPSLTELEISVSRALGKPAEELFTLLASIHKNRPQASEALGVSEQIYKLFEPYPLLNTVGADLACIFPAAIRWVMRGENGKALDAFLSIKNVQIDDKDTEGYLMLGQNLSAAAENAEQYIHFKKRWISYLIEASKYLEARKELFDFLKILPDDEDFITLKKKLMNVTFQ